MAQGKRRKSRKDGAEWSGVDRRERIVQAALARFATQGIPQTRLGEIAEDAGLDQPLINYYFPSIESLYAAVVERALEDLKTAVLTVKADPADPLAFLLAYARATMEWGGRKQGNFSIGAYFYYLASYSDRFARMNREIRITGRERISGMIYRMIELKQIPQPRRHSVPELATLIQGMMTGMLNLAYTEGADGDWKTHAQILENGILDALGAKRWLPPRGSSPRHPRKRGARKH